MDRRLLPLLLTVLLLTSCQWFQAPSPADPDPDFARVDYEALPLEVQGWVDNSRTMHIAHSKVYDGRRYIHASYGEKPTGGFGIHIEGVEIRSEEIEVIVRHSDPAPNQNVTEALTYPQDIVYTGNQNLPIEYVATGDRDYVPVLVGIEEMPEILAQSDSIKIFSPAPNSDVLDRFAVQGVANVFEGTVNYLIRDAEGSTDEHFITAGMGDWYYFEFELDLPEELSETFTLELFTYSAQDGSVIHLIVIPLERKQAD